MKAIIVGVCGRMGRELVRVAEQGEIIIVGGVDTAYNGQSYPFPVVTGYDQLSESADVLIDFSHPGSLAKLLPYCLEKHLPCILCATGYTDEHVRRVEEASCKIPILRSANMSIGIHVMEQLISIAAKALGADYDVEIVEKHHRMKLDSPSGTAIQLYKAIQGSLANEKDPVFGRHGHMDRREKGAIGIHSVRGGTQTGEHEVGFYGEGEQLVLTHRAENRALFAQGAIRAARFLAGKPAGLYTMLDVATEMVGGWS